MLSSRNQSFHGEYNPTAFHNVPEPRPFLQMMHAMHNRVHFSIFVRPDTRLFVTGCGLINDVREWQIKIDEVVKSIGKNNYGI